MKSYPSMSQPSECHPTLSNSFRGCFIKDFHAVWFASVMGTGISSTIFYAFPYPLHWLKVLGMIFFAIALLLFIMYNVIMVLKNFVFYKSWKFLTDVKESVFLGCYPMLICPIINMIVFLVTDYGDPTNVHWFRFIYILFWYCIVTSVACAWGITFLIFWKSPITDYKSHGINATLLLPLVTMTVASSTGSLMYHIIPEHMQLFHLILCFMLWSNTLLLLFPFITIYFAKLYITKLPPKGLIFTCFIPIGVFGQGAFGIVLFGHNCNLYLSASSIEDAKTIAIAVELITVLSALFLLSFGYFMVFLATTAVLSRGLHKKFSKAFWAMTFPLGTMSVGNSKLGEFYGLLFFKVMGSIFGVATILVTSMCLIGSLYEEFPHHWYVEKFNKKELESATDNSDETDEDHTLSSLV